MILPKESKLRRESKLPKEVFPIKIVPAWSRFTRPNLQKRKLLPIPKNTNRTMCVAVNTKPPSPLGAHNLQFVLNAEEIRCKVKEKSRQGPDYNHR